MLLQGLHANVFENVSTKDAFNFEVTPPTLGKKTMSLIEDGPSTDRFSRNPEEEKQHQPGFGKSKTHVSLFQLAFEEERRKEKEIEERRKEKEQRNKEEEEEIKPRTTMRSSGYPNEIGQLLPTLDDKKKSESSSNPKQTNISNHFHPKTKKSNPINKTNIQQDKCKKKSVQRSQTSKK